jgi:hypothetical protein
MPCPHCSTTLAQKRADGLCVACGKRLPANLRGKPDPIPMVGVEGSLMKAGVYAQWDSDIRAGDIVLLVMIHREHFRLFRLTPAEAERLPGPKYVAPPEWPDVGLFFTVDGWEEYDPLLAKLRKPWWKFW